MKYTFTFQNYILILVLLLFSSCASVNFYQVYKVTPDAQMKSESNNIYYEDANCIIYYDLWARGGDVSFRFYNKSDKTIEVLMEDSYFILNDEAFDYYKNRVFTESRFAGSAASSSFGYSSLNLGSNSIGSLVVSGVGVGTTKNGVLGKGQSTSYVENKVIAIPPQSFKRIEGYAVNNTIIRDCKLLKYPSKGEGNSKVFEEANSPLVFKNSIRYKLADNISPITVKNKFYVSEISNVPEKEIIGRRYEEFCGQKSYIGEKYIKIKSPTKFYLRYRKQEEFWRH